MMMMRNNAVCKQDSEDKQKEGRYDAFFCQGPKIHEIRKKFKGQSTPIGREQIFLTTQPEASNFGTILLLLDCGTKLVVYALSMPEKR